MTDATILSNGSIVIAMGQELRWYSEHGEFLFVTGREGSGPGEFEGRVTLAKREDGVVAYDDRLRRLTEYDLNGDMRDVVPLGGGVFESSFAALPEGYLLQSLTSAFDSDVEGLVRREEPLVLFDRSGRQVDTLRRLGGRELIRLARDGDFLIEESPFGRTGHIASNGGRVIVGDATILQFEQLPVLGAERSLVRGGKGFHLSRARLESERDALIGSDPSPGLLRLWDDLIGSLPQPLTVPAYQTIEVGDDGSVWLEEFVGSARTDSARSWEVFSPENFWLGQVELPAGFQAFEFGENVVLGVGTNALGVEAPQVLPITGGGR